MATGTWGGGWGEIDNDHEDRVNADGCSVFRGDRNVLGCSVDVVV